MALTFQDRTIVCSDCGKPFVFTAGEQAFYAEKGFGGGPKRCPQCRAARKAEREGGAPGAGPRPGGYSSGPRPAGPGFAPRPGGPPGVGGAPGVGGPGAPGGAPRGPFGPRPAGAPGAAFPRPMPTAPLMRGRGGPRLVVPVEEPYRINQRIRVPEVRVIVDDGDNPEENLGIMPTHQALQLAEERELDLVEVQPNAQPPVCKILDYGRFKYSQERKAREAKRAGQAGRAASEMKDVQLSPRIDDHDRDFKVERARGFLAEGHPVRLVVRFLGRDMRHPEVGMKALQEALEVLGKLVPITVNQQPRMEGRQLFALVNLAKGAKLPERTNGAARVDAKGPVGPADEGANGVTNGVTDGVTEAAAPAAPAPAVASASESAPTGVGEPLPAVAAQTPEQVTAAS